MHFAKISTIKEIIQEMMEVAAGVREKFCQFFGMAGGRGETRERSRTHCRFCWWSNRDQIENRVALFCYVVEEQMQIPLLNVSQRQCLLNETYTLVLPSLYFSTALVLHRVDRSAICFQGNAQTTKSFKLLVAEKSIRGFWMPFEKNVHCA